MVVKFMLADADGPTVAINRDGELRASPVADESKFHSMDAGATAFSFFPPIAGKQFCITLIHYSASQSVSPSADADVVLYQDDTAIGTTAAEADVKHRDAIVRAGGATMPALLLVAPGKFLNAKTSDPTVSMTIMGHYVKER